MTGRETAFRVLAREFNTATREEKGEGERAASYLVSALGTRMNRVLLVGRLSPPESVGKDPALPFLRARLEDPTGTVTVTSGTFQPRALDEMRRLTSPAPCVVVGKVHLFRGRDGTAFTSVRAEALRPVQDEEYRAFLAEAALATLDRLDRAGPEAAPEIREGLQRVVQAASAPGLPAAEPAPRPSSPRATGDRPAVSITRVPAAAAHPAPSTADRAQESAVLDLIDEIGERALDGYADLKELVERAAGLGIVPSRAEEIVNRLEESGAVEEPIVGKLRRA